MKKNKALFWIFTTLAAVPALGAGIAYLTLPFFVEAFKHFGFPDYFRIELGIAKIIGAIVLLFPKVPAKIKEWAYVGFAITFFSAAVSHTVVDGFASAIPPVIVFIFLILSYLQFQKLRSMVE